ncbi:DUF2726 domain-containing protein [Erwinia sp. HDF1-3R]|uniref:DUF2726 domain-containing protein n=1 Tax=Erwinia sp. HDF1-3R TaxID=3141543 RepID=UPI0031F508EC
MDFFIIFIFVFLVGFYTGRKSGRKKPAVVHSNANFPSTYPPLSRPYTPPKKFRHSRWEDRDELFWNMLREGVYLKRKRSGFLLSEVENIYREQLEEWFGQYCYINSQVSLGQLIDFPEQSGFSEEERKRFFSIFNGMAMDYVLVSKKTNRIVCVIELNDASHNEAGRIERDKKLEALMSTCAIPFLPVNIQDIHREPNIWEVRANTLAGST